MKFLKPTTQAVVLLAGLSLPAAAQLGRQQGLVEPNVAADSQFTRLGLNAHAVHLLKEAKPILSSTTLDSVLGAAGMTPAERAKMYGRMFVHVDVNRGSDAELLLIPGMDANKVKTIQAGRPWKDFASFRAAMAKVSNAADAERIEQYLFIPIDLNTWTAPIMDSFAGIGIGTARWKREFEEYRPWTSMEQFRREIGKYVRGNPKELTRLERYVIINK